MRSKSQHLFLLMTALMLVTGLVTANHASAQSTSVAQGITLDFVNLRSGPGVTFGTIVVVDPDVVVDVFGRNADATWYQVSTNGQQGWMARTYVALLSGTPTGLPIVDSTAVPTTNSAPTATPSTSSTTATGTNGVTVSWANLRSGPDVTFSRVAVLSRNTPLTITGRTANSVWLKVIAKGQDGWVFRTLVRVDAAVLAALPIVGGTTTTAGTTPTTPAAPTTNTTRPNNTGGMTVYPFGVGGSGANPEIGDNDTDGRISQFLFTTDAIVYCRDWNGWTDTRTYAGGGIIVYLWQGSVTGVVFYATEAMINATGVPASQPALIRAESGFALYRLPGGEFQMNGPNRDGSAFSLRWAGCNPSQQTQ